MSQTPWQTHVSDWIACTRCPLHACRKQVVLARGDLPCDVFFIGEAPGVSEDVIGQPFVGPAGQLLDKIIERSRVVAQTKGWSTGFSNLLACLPLDEQGGKASIPMDSDVLKCSPRLQEIVKLADPKLIVAVGNLPRDWLDTGNLAHIPLHRKIPRVSIKHPAYILRSTLAIRSVDIQRSIITIADAVDLYVGGIE